MAQQTKEAFYTSMSFSAVAQPTFIVTISLRYLSSLNQTSIHGTNTLRLF